MTPVPLNLFGNPESNFLNKIWVGKAEDLLIYLQNNIL